MASFPWLWMRIARCAARDWMQGYAGCFSRRKPAAAGEAVLAEFSTAIRSRRELGEANLNRIANMRLGCSLVDGVGLRPGEILSLARLIGRASARQGFKPGPIVRAGRLAMAPGGGLCQLSTTLFNAALLANLEIVERHNHSVDLWGEARFIELGRDATYAYPLKDLKIRNDRQDEIVFRISVDEAGQRMTCRIMAAWALAEKVEIASRLLEELLPPACRAGRAIPGWRVETRRLVSRCGEVRETYCRVDVYQPKIVPPERP